MVTKLFLNAQVKIKKDEKTAKVVGIMDKSMFASINGSDPQRLHVMFTRFEKEYPKWDENDGFLCYLLLDKPIIPITFEEYAQMRADDGIPLEELKVLYKYQIKPVEVVVLPNVAFDVITSGGLILPDTSKIVISSK